VSPILEVAIGVILVFLVVAVIVSTITEGVSGILHLRATTLERGLEVMLGKEGKRWLYGQPLITTSMPPGKKQRPPSYIDAVTFSTTLIGGLSAPTSQTLLAAILPSDVAARRQNIQAALQASKTIAGEAEKRADDVDALSRYLLDQLQAAPALLTREQVASIIGSLDAVKASIANLDAADPAKTPLEAIMTNQPPPQNTPDLLDKVIAYVGPLNPPSLSRLAGELGGFGLSQDSVDALKRLAQRADGDITRFREGVEDWFDRDMARVSGAYNRWSQVVMFAIALALAIGANISAYTVGRALWLDPSLRAAAVATAKQTVSTTPTTGPTSGQPAAGQTTAANLPSAPTYQDLKSLGLPIGWSQSNWPKASDPGDIILVVLGWVIIAVAASMGAPFWFDTLNKFVNLRTSGPPPDTAADQRAKAASH
jgi:hypothetical protein